MSNVKITNSKDAFKMEGLIDVNNSTTTPLGIGGVFTGTATEILQYGTVFINIYTDQDSAIDGLVIEQSSDGTNWDHSDVYSVVKASGKNYAINPYGKFLRVVYTNGIASQGVLRLQVLLKGYSLDSSHRIQDQITEDDDARLVKSVLTGQIEGDGFANVKVSPDGNLTISDNSNGLAIAEGDVTGKTVIHKFGNALNFNINDGFVTIWGGAEDGEPYEKMVYTYSTTADIDSLSSDDIGNTQLTEIQGLDANYDLVVQTATLNGQTKVTLATRLIRVFRVKNISSVDYAGHVFVSVGGTLTTGVPAPEDVRAVVHGDNNQTGMAVFTIPSGHTGYMRGWYASTAGAKKDSSHIIRLISRPFEQVFLLKHKTSIVESGTSSIQHKYEDPSVFTEKTDIEMRMNTDQDGVSVSAGFDIVIKEN